MEFNKYHVILEKQTILELKILGIKFFMLCYLSGAGEVQ
jgi:hypothetical protein